MLLRYYVNFYDMEIIEEEAFLAWKEDITQEFPGKGKALFQVWTLWTLPINSSSLKHQVQLCSSPGTASDKITFLCLCVSQVNQWLTWLETAEEEESEEEGD